MQEQEVRNVVAEVLAEQKRLHNNDVDEVVLKTLSTILTSFGIDEEDRLELKADFQHLRRWRKSTEVIASAGWKALVTILVTGFCGACWLVIKLAMGK
jgi:hypothetical protein